MGFLEASKNRLSLHDRLYETDCTTQDKGYNWNRLKSSAAKFEADFFSFAQVKKQLVESLIPYDRLVQRSEQSIIRILNDDSEQLHGLPLVAAWVSEDEVLLNYFIKRVQKRDFVTKFSTQCNFAFSTFLLVSIGSNLHRQMEL